MATFYYNSNFNESYESQWIRHIQNQAYLKDVSNSVAKVTELQTKDINSTIQNVSKEQSLAIEESTNIVCGSLNSGFELLSDNLEEISFSIDALRSEVNALASVLGWNLSLIIEQQRITNLLLGDIAILLRIPDIQKERQYHIEQGIKFLKNAIYDNDFYEDALKNLLEAEKIESTDYFVLHRIGLVYLYSLKHLNVEKAEAYFKKAAKYAIAETNSGASLKNNYLAKKKEGKYDAILQSTGEKKIHVIKVLRAYTGLDLKEAKDLVDSPQKLIKENITKEQAERIKKDFEEAGATILIKSTSSNQELAQESESDSLKLQAAEAYLFASRSCYIQGKFSEAAEFASKAFSLVPQMVEAGFTQAKALAANNNEEQAATVLQTVISLDRYYALKTVLDLDLCTKKSIKLLLKNFQEEATEKAKSILQECRRNIIQGSNATDYLHKIENLINKNTYLTSKKAIDLFEKEREWSFCEPFTNSYQSHLTKEIISILISFTKIKFYIKNNSFNAVDAEFFDPILNRINNETQWNFPSYGDIQKNQDWLTQIKSKTGIYKVRSFLDLEKKYNDALQNFVVEIKELLIKRQNENLKYIKDFDRKNHFQSVKSGIFGTLGGVIAGIMIGWGIAEIIRSITFLGIERFEGDYWVLVIICALIASIIFGINEYKGGYNSKRKIL